jgi:TolB-like protein/cytochrome c-type biogenesis protein CcmH/NrfG
VLLQVVDLVLDNVEAPAWVMDVFMLVVVLGFVVAMVIAWAYELTPEGIKRESEIDREQSVTHETAKKLNVITLGAVGVLVLFMLLDRFVLQPEKGSEPFSQTSRQTEPSGEQKRDLTPAVPAPALPEVNEKSIAVLPLANRSVNPEDAFFAEGIHDEILTRLSRIGSLKVISRTSVMGYAGTTKKMAEIGRELGVATLLEGGVQRAGNRVRINVQLIEAETDKHLWAEIFDRELTTDNLFDIQSEITRSISDALQAVLTGEEQLSLTEKPTENVEAYAYYLRGKALARGYGRTESEIAESIAAYEAALKLDPGFAPAWAALATDWIETYWVTAGIRGERDKALAALEKAREIAPAAAATQIAEGYYHYWGNLEYEQALAAFDNVLSKEPGNVLALRGTAYVLRRMGRLDDALATLQRAIELDPHDVGMPADRGYTMMRTGLFKEAELSFRQGITQDPNNIWNRYSYSEHFIINRDYKSARAVLGPVDGDTPGYLFSVYCTLALLEGDIDSLEDMLSLWEGVQEFPGSAEIWRGQWLATRGELGSYRETLLALEQPLLDAAAQTNKPLSPLSALVILYALLGDQEKTEAAIIRFETELQPDAMRLIEDRSRPYAYALTGDHDRLLDYADQLVEKFGPWELYYIVDEPFFEDVRGEPRYKVLALQFDRWLESVQ